MELQKIINSIERMFRYFLAGIIFAFLYNLSIESELSIPNHESIGPIIYIYILAFGMAIYAIHRIIYAISLDYILFKLRCTPLSNINDSYVNALGIFITRMLKEVKKVFSSYLFYRFSIIHFCLIFSEITFVLSCFSKPNSFIFNHKKTFIILSLILYTISIINYILLSRAAKKTYD